MLQPLLYLQLATTLPLVGLIWFVQVVHYPLFDHVGAADFARYESAHSRLTSYVVVVPMLAELACAAALAWLRLDGGLGFLAWLGLALVLAIWASTFLLQVPQHGVLGGGFDARAHQILVSTNWIRTVAWSARGVLALWMLWLAG